MTRVYQENELLLSINNLNVSYGNKQILRDLGNEKHPFYVMNVTRTEKDFQGQTIAIVGRSGRGKSTLFKTISGILEPHAGEIKIIEQGKNSSYRKIRQGDVGFVQQNYPLSRNQSITEMLQDAVKQSSTFRKKSKEVIETYLNDWGLWAQRKQCTNQLSGGQRQRVAIIEQILCEHYFMIFDEPFSGLDVLNIEDVKQSFAKIDSSHDINTIIFSTHDIELAVELADTVFVIGYEYEENKPKPGGTIIGYYDLKKMNLAWRGFSNEHRELAEQIKQVLRHS